MLLPHLLQSASHWNSRKASGKGSLMEREWLRDTELGDCMAQGGSCCVGDGELMWLGWHFGF